MKDTDTGSPLFTDTDISQAINDAINNLWPEIYKRTATSIGSTSITVYEYALPAGVERVGKVEIVDDNDAYQEDLYWEEEQVDFGETGSANAIVLRQKARTAGKDIRVTYRGKFTQLSGDASEADYPSYMDSAVVTEACALLGEQLLSERSRFTEYSAKIDREAATVDDLIKIIAHRHNEFHRLLDMYRMPPISSQRQRQLGLTEGVQPAHSGRSRAGVAPTAEGR